MRQIATRFSLNAPALTLPTRTSRVLMLSMRRVSPVVGSCALYEGEDVLAELLGTDVAYLTNPQGLHLSRRIYKLARYLTGSAKFAEWVSPTLGAVRLNANYDLFLPFFNHPHELYALLAVEGWRERCGVAACYLAEAWDADLPLYMIEMLRSFDHIFVGVHGAVDTIRRVCDRPCTYLPMGIDTLRFCPYPDPPARSIDVTSIGRRSGVTHEALLALGAKSKNFFYHHDTVRTGGTTPISFWVTDPREHRLLLANILKRSRYFIANRAWADRPGFTDPKGEIPARFYEGAAAGAVMLGDPPDTDDFREQFGWPDAVIRTPFNAPDIADVIGALDADFERTARLRADGVANSLLRHDWVYRLRELLDCVGLPSTDRMLRRQVQLRELAEEVRGVSWGSGARLFGERVPAAGGTQ